MPKDEIKTAFAKQFAKRVKLAREPLYKQTRMAELLGIEQDHYKHFETGRVIPHHLVAAFCELTHVRVHWLFTGEGERFSVRPTREKTTRDKAAEPIQKKRSA